MNSIPASWYSLDFNLIKLHIVLCLIKRLASHSFFRTIRQWRHTTSQVVICSLQHYLVYLICKVVFIQLRLTRSDTVDKSLDKIYKSLSLVDLNGATKFI